MMSEPEKKYEDLKNHSQIGLWYLLPILSGAGVFGGVIAAAKNMKSENEHFFMTLAIGLMFSVIYGWTIKTLGWSILRRMPPHYKPRIPNWQVNFLVGSVYFFAIVSFFLAGPIGLRAGLLFSQLFK